MNIYHSQKTPYLIRLQIIKVGEKTRHLALENTTLEEVRNMVKEVISKEKISPFEKGKVTNVNIREYFPYPESKSGKAISVSFKGINPDRTLDLILWHLNSITERHPRLNE